MRILSLCAPLTLADPRGALPGDLPQVHRVGGADDRLRSHDGGGGVEAAPEPRPLGRGGRVVPQGPFEGPFEGADKVEQLDAYLSLGLGVGPDPRIRLGLDRVLTSDGPSDPESESEADRDSRSIGRARSHSSAS